MRHVTAFCLLLMIFSRALSQEEGLLTRAERTDFKETSTHADVMAFLEGLKQEPHADRLFLEWMGWSTDEKEIPLLIARFGEAEDKLRVLVNANIHAGEVEGKEVAQMLLRSIARGEHEELLRKVELYIVPNFNPDGNDKIDRKNRVSQNGPDGGVGTRPNAAGLDLNRDFIKLESPECKALVAAFQKFDPHYFLDLHTTNGSPHAYHLTYAPSLSTNIAEELDAFIRKELLVEVREEMAKKKWRTFDYGNFPRRGPRAWNTYDHRPRFGTNYYGLRNRLSVVVEAYSYLDFESRVRVTHDFVVENLKAAAKHAAKIRALCDAADATTIAGAWTFGHSSSLAPPVEGEILVGKLDQRKLEGLGTRYIATTHVETQRMPIRVSFVSKKRRAPPAAWVLRDASEDVRDRLWRHGVRARPLAKPAKVACDVFVIDKLVRAHSPFQGHRNLAVEGRWVTRTVQLPAGTLVVSGRQRLARVAAQLLEPESEDSLTTWSFFRDLVEGKIFPVMRLPGQ